MKTEVMTNDDVIKILTEIAEDAENVRERCYATIRQLQGGTSRPLSRAKVKCDLVEKRRVKRLQKPKGGA